MMLFFELVACCVGLVLLILFLTWLLGKFFHEVFTKDLDS